MSTAWQRMSTRERRLVVGFAFFAEVFLGYFLLLDSDLARIRRLRVELMETQATVQELETQTMEPHVRRTGSGELPPVLPLREGESLDLALQRFLGAEIATSGATPVVIALPTPIPGQSADPMRHAHLVAAGSYGAVTTLIQRLGEPHFRVALQGLTVRPAADDSKVLNAELEVVIEPPGASSPAPSPSPATSPSP